MIPCSDNTSPANTYCHYPMEEKSQVCPVTSMKFQKKGQTIEPNASALNWSAELELVFTRDSDHEPISETRLDEL